MFRKLLIRLGILPRPWYQNPIWERDALKYGTFRAMIADDDFNGIVAVVAAYTEVGFNAADIMGLLVRPLVSPHFPHTQEVLESIVSAYENRQLSPEEGQRIKSLHETVARQSRLTQWL